MDGVDGWMSGWVDEWMSGGDRVRGRVCPPSNHPSIQPSTHPSIHPTIHSSTHPPIHVFPHWQPARSIEVWSGKGGHGGGDRLLLDDVLNPDAAHDKYMRAADQRSGAWSILTGIAANRSMETGQPVRIADLVHDIGLPDYPPMPSPDEPIPMSKPTVRTVSPERAMAMRDEAQANPSG